MKQLFNLAMAMAVLLAPTFIFAQSTPEDGKALIQAAQKDDLNLVKKAIESGVDVNFKTEYGATALFFACDRGNEKIVRYLLSQGADPNVQDTFYQATPLTWAQQKGEQEIILLLYAAGGNGATEYVLDLALNGKLDEVEKCLELKCVDRDGLLKIRRVMSVQSNSLKEKVMPIFEGQNLPEMKPLTPLPSEKKAALIGKYQGARFGLEVTMVDENLKVQVGRGLATLMKYIGDDEFYFGNNSAKFSFDKDAADGKPSAVVVKLSGRAFRLTPATEAAKEGAGGAVANKDGKPTDDETMKPDESSKEEPTEVAGEFVSSDMDVVSSNWPGFRGVGSRGIADGKNVPTRFDVKEKLNVKWMTPVAGLGMSCPSVWGDRVYVTTAVADGEAQNVKIGLYGDVSSVDDDRVYEFKVICLNKSTGSVEWERTANRAKPKVKRHAKSSHANPTVATNGSEVIAFFGSEGIYCYDTQGELKWKRDLGYLDSGWFYDAGYQWGFGSSPVIYQDRVLVQCDIQGQSFLAALSLKDGAEIWRTKRDEIPTWSTPTVHEFSDVTMVITNGTKSARGYDIKDGKELWALKGHSEIVVPTPSVAHGLIFVSSGYSPIQPIYAIKSSARGDISLEEGELENDAIQWSVKRGGPYMPTQIVYGDYLYCCANSGIISCYEAKTGKQMYRQRMRAPGGALSFTASPIAADGHLFCTAEDGRVLVVKAGPKFKLVETNPLNQSVLATPAATDGMLIFRGQTHVIAVGE